MDCRSPRGVPCTPSAVAVGWRACPAAYNSSAAAAASPSDVCGGGGPSGSGGAASPSDVCSVGTGPSGSDGTRLALELAVVVSSGLPLDGALWCPISRPTAGGEELLRLRGTAGGTRPSMPPCFRFEEPRLTGVMVAPHCVSSPCRLSAGPWSALTGSVPVREGAGGLTSGNGGVCAAAAEPSPGALGSDSPGGGVRSCIGGEDAPDAVPLVAASGAPGLLLAPLSPLPLALALSRMRSLSSRIVAPSGELPLAGQLAMSDRLLANRPAQVS